MFLDGTLDLFETATITTALTVENQPGSFVIEKGGMLTVPSGVGLILQGNLEVTGSGLLTGGGTVYDSGDLQLDPFTSATSDLGGGGAMRGTMGLGAFVQSNSGTLSIGLSSTGAFTPLTVTGEADLLGILTLPDYSPPSGVPLLPGSPPPPGFVPPVGAAFLVVIAGAVADHFDSIPDGMVETDGPNTVTVTQINPPA